MLKIPISIIGLFLLTPISFAGDSTPPKKWDQKQKPYSFVFSINKGSYGLAELYINEGSCKDVVFFGFVSDDVELYSIQQNAKLEILNINDINVQVEYAGKNDFDVYFYMAKSARGKDYILNQFETAENVSASLPNGPKNVFSSNGFSKTRTSQIKACEKRKEIMDNAL